MKYGEVEDVSGEVQKKWRFERDDNANNGSGDRR